MPPKLQTRERIMEAAEAVFAEKGYHDAAMDEIVRRTSVSKGGLYFHFSSKERLFFAVMDHLGPVSSAASKIESPRKKGQSTGWKWP